MGKIQTPESGRRIVPTMERGKTYVNPEQEDQMEVTGFKLDRRKQIVTWIFIVLTVGLLRLVFYWKPSWFLLSTHTQCRLDQASCILLRDQYMQQFVEPVQLETELGQRLEGSVLRDMKDVARDNGLVSDMKGEVIRLFVNKKLKYIWHDASNSFQKLKGQDSGRSCADFHEASPIDEYTRQRRRALYGSNLIQVKVQPVLVLLFTQVLNPFYVFQLFSCILWFCDEYYYYASAIVVMSAASLSAEILQTRAMQRALKNTVSANDIVTRCSESSEYEDVMSDQLVPGDLIEIPRHGCLMHCDAVLISGNCIVNESMLTGESVPVTKTPLPNPKVKVADRRPPLMFDMKEHNRHVLFCGTNVIQGRYYGNQRVRAVVVRTGFSTAKGDLVRSIMFPKPVDFKFSQDAFKFIGVLAAISSIGMVYTAVVMSLDGTEPGDIVVRMLDLVTIVIPPALPAAMTIGIVFAQRRLKTQNVFCISPKSITQCGVIDLFCFDKTGTLTEDGLDMWGVIPVRETLFQSEERNVSSLGREKIVVSMATCHSLTIIEGTLSGDPLDLKMFQSTEWDLEEPGEDATRFDTFMPTVVRPKGDHSAPSVESADDAERMRFEVGIVRQFPFSSKLQRMSVVARSLNSHHFDLYVKGAPEMIASLSRPDSVPADFHDVLLHYTQQGYRVLALAHRPLKKFTYVKIQRSQREQFERDLVLLGLLVMENRLKPETTAIIDQLSEARIRTVMVTGDNMLTALSVARDCHLVERRGKVVLVHVAPPGDGAAPSIQWTYAEDARKDVKEGFSTADEKDFIAVELDAGGHLHFAVTGSSWALLRQHFPDVIPKILVRGTVFARFSPDQKQQLVETLQELGYYVGMCGDGANDCGALKTAHTGISLSETEASVASPFTSKTPNISCVPTVIREGRAALVTSFGVFKYMAAYSLTQFVSVCMLYWIGANLTDFIFLYVDLFLITTLGATFSYTGSYPELVAEPPPVSLISLVPILSIVVHILITTGFQVFTYVFIMAQPWFEHYVINEDNDYMSYEVTGLFAISCWQYVTLAVVFSKGPPYRKTLFSNVLFLANIILCTALNLWVVMFPTEGLANFLELKLPPSIPFRGIIVFLAIINFFLCFLVETYVMESGLIRRRCQAAMSRRSRAAQCRYLAVEDELSEAPHWPPVSQSCASLADILRLETPAQHLNAAYSDEEEEEGEGKEHEDPHPPGSATPRPPSLLPQDSVDSALGSHESAPLVVHDHLAVKLDISAMETTLL